jgi:hypothetical protein
MARLLHQLAVYFGLSEPSDEEAKLAEAYRGELRGRLRTPGHWLANGVLACCMGVGVEGAVSLMSDDRFEVSVALRWFAAIFVTVSITRLWEGFGRN